MSHGHAQQCTRSFLQALPPEGPTFAGGGSLDPRAVYTPSDGGSPHASTGRPLVDALKSSSGWVQDPCLECGTGPQVFVEPCTLLVVTIRGHAVEMLVKLAGKTGHFHTAVYR